MLLPAARQVVQEREERTDDDDAPVELGEGDEGSHGPQCAFLAHFGRGQRHPLSCVEAEKE